MCFKAADRSVGQGLAIAAGAAKLGYCAMRHALLDGYGMNVTIVRISTDTCCAYAVALHRASALCCSTLRLTSQSSRALAKSLFPLLSRSDTQERGVTANSSEYHSIAAMLLLSLLQSRSTQFHCCRLCDGVGTAAALSACAVAGLRRVRSIPAGSACCVSSGKH